MSTWTIAQKFKTFSIRSKGTHDLGERPIIILNSLFFACVKIVRFAILINSVQVQIGRGKTNYLRQPLGSSKIAKTYGDLMIWAIFQNRSPKIG